MFNGLNKIAQKFVYSLNTLYLCTQDASDRKNNMSQIEYITVKNAPRKVLNRMRQIGVEKAKRLQEIQERWENGEYKNVEVVQL